MTGSEHFARLAKAYREVGDRTWSSDDFLSSNLEVSRGLFVPESLVTRRPKPKQLEVFALLSGLPFQAKFTDRLIQVQQEVSAILGERLHYWVAPANLGLEYCVFKWPMDVWSNEWLDTIENALGSIRLAPYRLNIRGVQINPDGCVVAKGFDENSILFQIRGRLKVEIPFLPVKQSQWAHIPLGRILEPVGEERFSRLAQLTRRISDIPIATTEIDCMKLVHETQWYMEAKTVLASYPLTGAS